MLFCSINSLVSPPFGIDGVELRLDLTEGTPLEEIRHYIEASPIPIMLTHRGASEKTIEELLALSPEYVDLDWSLKPAKLIEKYPGIKFILSHHDFEKTPEHLEELYQQMRATPAFAYKIAAKANSTNDALKMLLFSKRHPDVSAICMGERGTFARALGPVVENVIDYASYGKETAPGQLSVDELLTTYRYKKLGPSTKIYGLIGNPVDLSRGHIFHNEAFEKKGFDGIYVKMAVEKEELEEFFSLAKELGIRGLSVTMPLKEKVVAFVDAIDPKAKEIGALNTLRIDNGNIWGTNTDGKGALDAIEKRGAVLGKEMVVLGAGGAARAIAVEAKRRGASLSILNRTEEKAKALAQLVGGEVGAPKVHDIVVNCSPAPLPFSLRPKTTVMDAVYSLKETPILKRAKELDCEIVYGEEMFVNQAIAQSELWTSTLHFGKGLLKSPLLQELCSKDAVVIVDSSLTELYGKPIAKKLGAALIVAPKGKTRASKEAIEDQLLALKMGRDTTIVAVGGGETTDLVGFVASTYLRGVLLILVPTTLLAMVDAAIGGKTGIDTPFGKNTIGSFYPAKAIVADIETLETLPKKEMEHGLVECIKLGLVYERSILELLHNREELIYSCARIKEEIVRVDPKESGLRRILNFGHTIGHGLETITEYKIAHGEAVAIGCVVEAHLSMALGYLKKEEFALVQSYFPLVQLPKGYERGRFLEALSQDKKRAGGNVRFVLLEQIGKAAPFEGAYCRPVSLKELEPTLKWMEQC